MYEAIFDKLEQIAQKEAARLCPKGFDISLDAPQSLEAICEYFDANGRPLVSCQHDADSIFNTAEGFRCFRAWHDMLHILLKAPFDRDGEYQVFLKHCENLRRYDMPEETLALLVEVVRAEIVGQFDYKVMNGDYPQYQRAFTIDFLQGRY